jgi:hypothetical protein
MSPIIQPDTSNLQEMGAIPAGTYPAEIQQVDFKTSKSDNPMIVVKFGVEVDGKVRARNSYLVITGEGAYGFDQLLRACGFTDLADQYKDKSITNKPQFDTDHLVGQRVNVVIEPNMYNGELRDQIKSFLKA